MFFCGPRSLPLSLVGYLNAQYFLLMELPTTTYINKLYFQINYA